MIKGSINRSEKVIKEIIICNISALKCVKAARPFFFILLSCVFTLFQINQTIPEVYSRLKLPGQSQRARKEDMNKTLWADYE